MRIIGDERVLLHLEHLQLRRYVYRLFIVCTALLRFFLYLIIPCLFCLEVYVPPSFNMDSLKPRVKSHLVDKQHVGGQNGNFFCSLPGSSAMGYQFSFYIRQSEVYCLPCKFFLIALLISHKLQSNSINKNPSLFAYVVRSSLMYAELKIEKKKGNIKDLAA